MTADRLDAPLRRLAELTGDPAATALQQRWAGRRFRILIAGEAKRGKSTLVNALIGRPLLPTGVTPLTALPVTVHHGDSEKLVVTFGTNRVETRPVADLSAVATESGNPGNRLGITDLTLTTRAPLLSGNVELVDTPGVGTVYQQSSAAATAALDTMDAAILVLTADPPISASERALLSQLRDKSMAVFCVLNKADRLDAGELDEVTAYTRTVLDDALGRTVPIYPCTARAALDPDPTVAARSGLGALTAALRDYLGARRERDLNASIAGHAGRLCERYLDNALLTRRAVAADDAQDADRVQLFAIRVAQAQTGRTDAADLARAELARMLKTLNTVAAADSHRLAAQVAGRAGALVDDAGPQLSTAEAEDSARTAATAVITELADDWRHAQQARLEGALQALVQRVAADLDTRLSDLRTAAHDLIGVDLSLPAPDDGLLPPATVSYALAPAIGITVAWEAAIRRHLPGRYGRRRVRAHLIRETRALTDQQIGRIRAAFQQNLREAGPQIIAAIDARYTTALAGLTMALDAARSIAAAPDRAAQLAHLDQRISDLQSLHRHLRADGAPGSPPAVDPAATPESSR